ncbi:histidine phosphatase family protein [Tissierella creatinophila]|uniref:phosphoglycerate mutase (2,3-diphosphoglycerate-dependent) n=1 Tax=Tissierella creatinophila DSM 6911 TaxID=1123403 RepID=A0A1U7M5D1_TISCR|nr:histidine phosphatase family protein [Tissierella creatinophila]OLS02517.1 putative phosphoserine phosphatase 2 [Tissierella creatinophila DSM 6911]
MKLYIIRHGQTQWNIQKRLQGWNNSNLTQKGISDAMNLAERLKDIDFTHIYSSTQKRAIETAEILRKDRNIDIIKLEGLKEIGFGKWEGMEMDEVLEKYKDEFDIYLNKPHLYKPTLNGESYEEIFKRVRLSLDEILKSGGEDILIVSHGVTIKILTSIIKNIPLEKLYTIDINKGTSLNICEVKENKIEFIVEGDNYHIR